MAPPSADPRPITPHPFAEIFPPMSREERHELEESIRKNGLREAIIIDKQNRILDGLNRYRACLAIGVTPQFEMFQGTEEEAATLIWDANMVRRQLSTSVKAAIGADWSQLQRGQRKSGNSQISVAEAAKRLGISESSINVAKAVKRVSSELHVAMKTNVVSVNAAERITKLPEPTRSTTIAATIALARGSRAKVPRVHDDWDSLLYRVRNICRLPSQLRVIPDRLGEHPLSPSRANELRHALRHIIEWDFADLVIATREAIGVLDTIIEDEPIKDLQSTDTSTGPAQKKYR